MSNSLPTGTVAFLFTDIQGSTQLWQKYPAEMPEALAQHHALLTKAIEAHHGYVFQIIGDAFCAAFHTTRAALESALSAQLALGSAEWGATGPIRVRMAVHAGAAEVRPGETTSGEYVSGITLSRAARLLSAGHGGQVLLSLPTAELARDHLPERVSLLDLGSHRLKDLIRPEQICQLLADGLEVEFPPLKTLDALPHNLPIQITSFIGRDKEIFELTAIIGEPARRMHTLLGPGGAGKTRLALQVAAECIEKFPDGAWLVDLSAIDDPDLVYQTVTGAWGLREQPGYALLDTLKDFLRHKRLLLILDNCEHVLDACARLCQALLLSAIDLHLLTTSREPLGVPGEALFRLSALSTPDLIHLPSLESLSAFDSVRLFIDRARLAQPAFSLTNANAPAVAQICSRLDGIPLAIELAAARARSFTPDQINARLEDRFRLLTGGSRLGAARQQTLQAALDWSHDLLNPSERVLFRRLAVFHGGWTFEACEAICTGSDLDPYEILDLLPRLVDRSLVVGDELPEGMRYRLLDTIRMYSRQKLAEAGEETEFQARHLDECLRFAAEHMPLLEGARQLEALVGLDAEQDNFRAALEYAVDHEPIEALRLVYFLWLFWFMRGYFVEGRRWAERAFQAADGLSVPDQVHSQAICALASFNFFQGEIEAALRLSRTGLDFARRAGDCRAELIHIHHIAMSEGWFGNSAACQGILDEGFQLARSCQDKMLLGWLTMDLGSLFLSIGDLDQAEKYYSETADIARRNGDRWGLSFQLGNLSEIVALRGQLDQAEILSREAEIVFRQLNDRHGLAFTLCDLAKYSWQHGDLILSSSQLKESLEIERQLGRDRSLPSFLEDLASFMIRFGGDRPGAILIGASQAFRTTQGYTERSGVLAREIPLALARAQAQLGEVEFQAALVLGQSLSLEQAIELALSLPPADRNPGIDVGSVSIATDFN